MPTIDKIKNWEEKKKYSRMFNGPGLKPRKIMRKTPPKIPSRLPIIPPIAVIRKISARGILCICLKVPPSACNVLKSFILETVNNDDKTLETIIVANKEKIVRNERYCVNTLTIAPLKMILVL